MSLARAEGLPHQFPEGVNPEDKDKLSAEFRSSLILIQSRPLNPDTIDTYAENALSDLVDLSASITDAYRSMSPTFSGLGRDLEDQAFEHFGLKSINGVLSYVAAKDAEIKQIGRIVESAENTGQVIVPPDKIDPPTGDGNGEFKKKSVISRTKTVLFILANDFGIDLNNPDDFSIKTGVLTDTMMRGLSYYQISVPSLGRTILCCDEEGNVSYVFDNKVLEDHGITPDDLATLTKNDINDLLDSDAKMGKRVVYSPKFVSRMIGLMTDLEDKNKVVKPRGLYFYPRAPEGFLPVKGLADDMGIDFYTVVTAIDELGKVIGEVESYRFGKFGTKLTVGYSPEQKERIRKHLEQKGTFSIPPEGTISMPDLESMFDVHRSVIEAAMSKIGDSFGPTPNFKFGVRPSPGFNQAQQKILKDYLTENGYFVTESSDGILSAFGVAEKFEVGHREVSKAIKKLGKSLGEAPLRKFGYRRVPGYSLEQQALIYAYLESKNYFVPKATEGTMSATKLAKKIGTSDKKFKEAVKRLKPTLGVIGIVKFQGVATDGYLPWQIEIIEQDFRDRGYVIA